MSTGLFLPSQRYGSKGGSCLCTRLRVAEKIDGIVLQSMGRSIDADQFQHLRHDCEVRM